MKKLGNTSFGIQDACRHKLGVHLVLTCASDIF